MATTANIVSNTMWLIKADVYNSSAFVICCMSMLFLWTLKGYETPGGWLGEEWFSFRVI